MAYASAYDTLVCELRYKLFVWTLDLRRKGYIMNFTLLESKNWNQIDLAFTFRDAQGNLLDLFSSNNVDVNIGLIHYVTNLINGHIVQYGCHVQ